MVCKYSGGVCKLYNKSSVTCLSEKEAQACCGEYTRLSQGKEPTPLIRSRAIGHDLADLTVPEKSSA